MGLEETQKHFNEAASWIASLCWSEHITNTNTAHHRVYGETRSRFGLGAQLAVCARAKAVEAVKVARTQENQRKPDRKPVTCPQFGPRGSLRYDARTYRLMSLDRVSLNTLQGRVECRLLLGKRQHGMLIDRTWKIGGADSVWSIWLLTATVRRSVGQRSSLYVNAITNAVRRCKRSGRVRQSAVSRR